MSFYKRFRRSVVKHVCGCWKQLKSYLRCLRFFLHENMVPVIIYVTTFLTVLYASYFGRSHFDLFYAHDRVPMTMVVFKESKLLQGANCYAAWNFSTNFSSYSLINPDIYDYELYDSNSNDDYDEYEDDHYKFGQIKSYFDTKTQTNRMKGWNYSVTYQEHFGKIPYFLYTNVGHANITSFCQPFDEDCYEYFIVSYHRTCTVNQIPYLPTPPCVYSKGGMTFRWHVNGCIAQDVVTVKCPTVLKSLCQDELTRQRRKVLDRLNEEMNQLQELIKVGPQFMVFGNDQLVDRFKPLIMEFTLSELHKESPDI